MHHALREQIVMCVNMWPELRHEIATVKKQVCYSSAVK